MILSYTDIGLCGSNVPGVRVKGLAGHDWTKHSSQWGGSAFVARYLVLFHRSRIETDVPDRIPVTNANRHKLSTRLRCLGPEAGHGVSASLAGAQGPTTLTA